MESTQLLEKMRDDEHEHEREHFARVLRDCGACGYCHLCREFVYTPHRHAF